MSLLSGYREKDAVRIKPMYAEDWDYNTFLTFRITYRSGKSRGSETGTLPGMRKTIGILHMNKAGCSRILLSAW